MAGGSVATDDDGTSRAADFTNRISHCAATETSGQTGHGGRMSKTGTVVHVISLHDSPSKFLGQVVFFVGASGRGNEGKLFRFVT